MRTLKKGKYLFVAFETNLFKAVTRPVRGWTSLTFFGGSMYKMAWILLGFASIPLYETMNTRNFLDETLKAHLLGFSLILYRLLCQKSPIDRPDVSFRPSSSPTYCPHKLLHSVLSVDGTCD